MGKRKFNPDRPPFATASGMNVECVRINDTLMGVVHDADHTHGFFCTWDLLGKRMNIFPRTDKDSDGSDLVNSNG